MRTEQDDPASPTSIDLVFEALARLAGALEANRAIRRSHAGETAKAKSPRKKSSGPLDVRNDNITYRIVTNTETEEQDHE